MDQEFSVQIENGLLDVSFSERESIALVRALKDLIRKISSTMMIGHCSGDFESINRASRMAISLHINDRLNSISKEDIEVLKKLKIDPEIKNVFNKVNLYKGVYSDGGAGSIVQGDAFAKKCVASIND